MKARNLKLFFCLSAILLVSCSGLDDTSPEQVVVGNQAPTFSLTALDGATVKSSSLKGSTVILNFWATWCQPCMSEIPELKELADTSRVKIIGIALDQDGLKTVKPFVEDYKINYTVLLGDENVFQRFNGVGIPYTLVLDSSQRIVKIYRGPVTKETLEQALNTIN